MSSYWIFLPPNFNCASLKDSGQRGTWRCFAISCNSWVLGIQNLHCLCRYLSDIVCKQLRVVFLLLGGQIGGKVLDGHLSGPLGEGEQDAGKSSMRLVPGPGHGVLKVSNNERLKSQNITMCWGTWYLIRTGWTGAPGIKAPGLKCINAFLSH